MRRPKGWRDFMGPLILVPRDALTCEGCGSSQSSAWGADWFQGGYSGRFGHPGLKPGRILRNWATWCSDQCYRQAEAQS